MNHCCVRFPGFVSCLLRLLAGTGLGLLLLPARAQSWTAAYGGGGSGDDDAVAVVTDAAGTQYVAGRFENSITFGTTTLSSAGNHDIFVAARSSTGQWLWAKRAGGNGDDTSGDLRLGPGGDLWLASSYATSGFGTVATYGPASFTSQGNWDVAVSRLSATGQWRWTAVGGGAGVDFANTLAVSPTGEAAVAGDYGLGAPPLADSALTLGSTRLPCAGSFDIFAARLSATGQWTGAVRAGGPGYDRCYRAVAGPGNALTLTGVIGATNNGPATTADFGPIVLTSQGGADLYVARLSGANQWSWAVAAGGSGGQSGLGIALDPRTDEVFVTGFYNSAFLLGSSPLPAVAGPYDGFVAKLDTAQQWAWAHPISSPGAEVTFGVAVEPGGEVLVAGTFGDSLTLGATTLIVAGLAEGFVGVLSAQGQWLGGVASVSTQSAVPTGFGRGATGEALLVGYFSGTTTFGSAGLTSAGQADFFVATLNRTLLGLAPDAAPAAAWTVLPNPAARTARLTRASAALPATAVQLFDGAGRCVGTYALAAGQTSLTLPLEGLPAGLYLVRGAGGSQRLVVE